MSKLIAKGHAFTTINRDFESYVREVNGYTIPYRIIFDTITSTTGEIKTNENHEIRSEKYKISVEIGSSTIIYHYFEHYTNANRTYMYLCDHCAANEWDNLWDYIDHWHKTSNYEEI